MELVNLGEQVLFMTNLTHQASSATPTAFYQTIVRVKVQEDFFDDAMAHKEARKQEN